MESSRVRQVIEEETRNRNLRARAFVDHWVNAFSSQREEFNRTAERIRNARIRSEATLNEISDSKVVLTQEEFEQLPTMNYLPNDNECTICKEMYKEQDSLVILPCCHRFHRGCIKKWLKEQKACCPTCRFELKR